MSNDLKNVVIDLFASCSDDSCLPPRGWRVENCINPPVPYA